MSNPNHTRPCSVDGCQGHIGDNSVTGLCQACYNSLYGWEHKKSARDRVMRANKLNLYINRLCYLLPDDKIQMLSTRKKMQPLVVLPGHVKQYRRKTKYKNMVKERIASNGG